MAHRLALLLVAAVLAAPLLVPADATHTPANKTFASGSAFTMASAPLSEGSSSEEMVLLSGSMRTSSPTDLLVTVSLECALWTEVAVVGNGDAESAASVTVWVEMDGRRVPVADGDDGEVVFCDRVHGADTRDLDDQDARFRQYLRTRSANAFHWALVDAGSGVHEFVVKARVDAHVSGLGEAHGAVGKRTLLVEPVKMANHAVA